MAQAKMLGFLAVVLLWLVMTFFCISGLIVFDNTTLGGAMLSGLILSTSILGILRILKIIYDGLYSSMTKDTS